MDFQKDLIAEYDREAAKTRKMLDAIPADADFGYKPHPKSMALGRLAGHLTDMVGDWAVHSLELDKLDFPADHKWEQYVPASKAALLEKFDTNCHAPGQRWPRPRARSGISIGSSSMAGMCGLTIRATRSFAIW